MKILRSDQVREVDAYTIKNEPVLSIDLMERAALACTNWIANKYGTDTCFKIFVGPGNNGGDGLAIARMLADRNYKVEVFIVKITEKLTGDSLVNYERLIKQNKVKVVFIKDDDKLPEIGTNNIILDGLFGSGLTRPLKGLAAKVVNYLNKSKADIIAIDIPSGLFGENNSGNDFENIIKAKYTLSFQFPGLSFFFPESGSYVGEWQVLPIGLHEGFIEKVKTNYFFISKKYIKPNIIKRQKFAHKGNFGHALLISGSYGKMGAAVLASAACLRTGIGLITVHIPKLGYDIMQTAIPEAMISIDQSDEVFTKLPDINPFNAIGIGPGIGVDIITQSAIKDILNQVKVPLVIDADALNILSENKNWLSDVPANSIFTPHPKEFERLEGKSKNHYSQNLKQIEFAKKYNIYLVLKGAHTSIACPDGTCYFNTTGNPGMATAGSGDVLTGIILSLLGQGYSSKNAAIIGVYLHGLAGDLAMEETGEESLIAGDITQKLGKAFRKISCINANSFSNWGK